MKKHLLSRKRLSTIMYSILMMLLYSNVGWGQTATDGDYRTAKITGNWSDADMWEFRTAGVWAVTTLAPTATNNVYVQNGHTVTVDVPNAFCKDLQLNTLGVLAIGTNIVNVNGKIRAYTTTLGAVTGATDGTFYSDQTSSTVTASTMITTTNPGVLKFVGGTRTITTTGEWNSSGTANAAEFALDANAIGTLNGVGVKFKPIVISSGTVATDAFISVSNGDFTINNGAKLVTSRSTTSGVIGNSSTAPCGIVTIESGGILELTGSAPTINCTTFINNGTIVYNRAGTQSLLAAGVVTPQAGTTAYNNYNILILSNTSTKTATLPITVSNLLKFTGTATLGLTAVNTLTMFNNSTVERSVTSGTSLPSTAGFVFYGTSPTDLVNVTIGSSISNSNELPLTPAPGKVGTLNVNSGVTYTITGGRTVTNVVNNNIIALVPGSTLTFTINGNISGTGTISGSPSASITFGGAFDGNAGTISFTSGSQFVNNFTLNRVGINSSVTLGTPVTMSASNLNLTAGTIIGSGNLTLGNGATIVKTSGSLDAAPIFGSTVNVTYNGTTAISSSQEIPTSTTVLNNLTINNVGGVTLTTPTAVNNKLTLTSGTLDTGGFLTLKSNASKTAFVGVVTGSISGNVTTERYIPAGHRAYRLLSPATTGGTINANWQEGGLVTTVGGISNPFLTYGTHITGTGGSANGFDTTTSNAASIFEYNNTTPAWTALISTSGTLAAGSPYLIYIRGSRLATNIDASLGNDATTLRTTGTLLTGLVPVSGLNGTAGGFSVVGNPYQAQVDMNKVLVTNATAVNLASYYYVVDPKLGTKGAYATVDLVSPGLSTAIDANQYLQPGQACFVQTVATSAASLNFIETDKYEGTQTSVFRTKNAAAARLLLTLTDASATNLDRLVIAFDSSETNSVNQNDASKLTNFDESLASSNNGKLLAIEKRAMPTDADEIPLNITKYRGTSYSIKAEGSGLTGSIPYLLDQYANKTTEIPQDGSVNYAYTVDAGIPSSIAADRFKLIYAKTLKTIDNTITSFALYPNPSKTNSFSVVIPQSMSKASLTVSNMLGQQMYSQNDLQSGNTVNVTASNVKTAGVYLVSLTSEGKTTTTTKWIVE